MADTEEFQGLTAVVTGTAQGIGQAIAAELGQAGAKVIAVEIGRAHV